MLRGEVGHTLGRGIALSKTKILDFPVVLQCVINNVCSLRVFKKKRIEQKKITANPSNVVHCTMTRDLEVNVIYYLSFYLSI